MSDNYDDLLGTGYAPPTIVPPEKEFFKSVYICGISRKNHVDIVEVAGKLQVRGFQYNLDKINMIITHVKRILVKKEKDQNTNRDKVACFSFMKGQKVFKGTSGNICPSNRKDRDATPACSGCRGELIVSGILTNEQGIPIMIDDEDTGTKKSVFIFIRGNGLKYNNISTYLDNLSKEDIQPPIFPDNQTLEKMIAQNKRFVTVITVGEEKTKFGMKKVFELNTGAKIADAMVKKVIDIQKKTLPQFCEKFDWSSRNNQSHSYDDDSEGDTTPTTQTTSVTPATTADTEEFLKNFDF
jgi:hypothetical protein